MKRVRNWFKRLFTGGGQPALMMRKMLLMLAATRASELSCDDVYALLDQFAEAVMHGDPLTEIMASIEQHLSVCPDCREEYEALMAMLKPA
jgi:hypothetical protein